MPVIRRSGRCASRRSAPGPGRLASVALDVPFSLPSGSYVMLACVGTACRSAPRVSVADVALAAPAVGTDRPTDFAASTAFLYSGDSPAQQGVTAGAIADGRVAVVRGHVVDLAGQPVPGVRVSVLSHPELGFTRTRLDGMFDLAVNGGGQLDLDYRIPGYLPVQRSDTVPWHDFVAVPDVALTPLDAAVTSIVSGAAGWQVHRATAVTDADGSRRATLLFAPGTSASLRMANGTLQPVPAIAVRATEFTAGPTGLDAMPGALPPSSGYTYAVEYTADEAIAAGAVGVTFSQPVVTYTEDFVGFPVGTAVPAGTYNAGQGRWEADPNGWVVQVVSIAAGRAALDIDGDGVADPDLTALGITSDELDQLGALYPIGAKLLRVPTSHFSSSDYNWPFGPPTGSTAPGGAPQNDAPGTTCRAGSIIICESQTLAERVPVAGTPYALVYASDRVPGRTASRSLEIPLRPATMPLVPNAIHVVIRVAGQTIQEDFPPTALSTTFTWDGRDAYGRAIDGWVPVTVQIGYEYFGQYYATQADKARAFGAFSGVQFTPGPPPPPLARRSRRLQASTTIRVRRPIVIWKEWHTSVGGWDLRGLGLGGWVLDPMEIYDRDGGVLLNGDGTSERADRKAYAAVSLLAGWNGSGSAGGFAGDGGSAVGARLSSPDGVAVAPDGTVYVADTGNGRVRRIATDGTITTVYGGAACPAPSCRPADVAIGTDGSLYVADTNRHVVVRLTTGGGETLVAGNGTTTYSGDGGPATSAGLQLPAAIAVGPDDAVWIKDTGLANEARIRRVAPDGTIATAIGGGPAPPAGNPYGDGLAATDVHLGNGDVGLAVGPDGTVYVVDPSPVFFIRAVGTDGISHRFAGGGPVGPGVGDGGPAVDAKLGPTYSLAVGPDGSVYIGEAARLRRVAPDGTISTVAGNGTGGGYAGDGGPAGSALVFQIGAIAIAPNGDVVFADRSNHRLRVVRSVLPNATAGELALASADGAEIYRFDAAGRHVATLDGLTGTTLETLAYDAAGRLVTLTDRHGLTTKVEHDGSGRPTAIVAPGGQRTVLTVDGDGFLQSISDPAAHTMQLASVGHAGLLATLADPRGNVHRFGYDALGRLQQDQDPAGGVQTLTRNLLTDGVEVTVTTALGRQTLYRTELMPDGSALYRTTAPSGAVRETVENPDGTVRTTFPDGRIEDLTTGPDPRFGERVALVTRDVVTEPSGPTATFTAQRTATIASGGGVATLSDSVSDNGATWTLNYVGAAHTLTLASPQARTVVETMDTRDDVVSVQQGTLTPTTATYDARGRMTHVEQGAVARDLAYDTADRLVGVTDAVGHATHYGYDAAGRITSQTTPSGRVFTLARDASGDVTQIGMPGGGTHTIARDPLGRLASYTAPGRSALTMAYTADGEIGSVTGADARVITPGHDAAGRATGAAFPEGSVALAYADLTDRVTSATATPGSGTAQSSAFEYSGDLVTRDNQSGAANGDFRYTWTNSLDVGSWSLDSVPSTTTHDLDRRVTGDGPWTHALDANGLVTSIANSADGTDAITYQYDALGRLTRRAVNVNGTVAFQVDLGYDAAGRVASRTDTIAGTPAARAYVYDVDGRLTGVSGTGETSSYTYDAHDNLTSSPAGTSTFTADDRVAGVDDVYGADGRLTNRGSDSFVYDARGDLLSAVGNGTNVTYDYDAEGRRVTRTAGGVTTEYLYGNLARPFQVTATKQGGVTTIYRYDDDGNLAAFERSGTRYLVATDLVGSPLAVYDASSVTPVLTRSYDAYGRVTPLTGSLDLPIGFAGGLADPATGLVRFGYRDYEPERGRFTAPDPSLYDGGQYNLYAYVGGDPVSGTDRWGLGDGQVCALNDKALINEGQALRRELQSHAHDDPHSVKQLLQRQDLLRRMQDLTNYVTPQGMNDHRPLENHALSSSGAATRG